MLHFLSLWQSTYEIVNKYLWNKWVKLIIRMDSYILVIVIGIIEY